MERYYYHGVGDYIDEETLDHFITILNSGYLKSRNEVHPEDPKDKDINYICLYKKNDDYHYDMNDPESFEKSAFAGWIGHGFFFIISPDINATKMDFAKVRLVDEWRSYESIPFSKVVGIALPFDGIEEDKQKFPEFFTSEFDKKLDYILKFAQAHNWRIENSDDESLCDRLDEELNQSSKIKL